MDTDDQLFWNQNLYIYIRQNAKGIMMRSMQEYAEETKQQLELLMKKQRRMTTILKSFPDCVIVTLENGLKGYTSSKVDGAKGARPEVLFVSPGTYYLRYVVDFSGTQVYSKISRVLLSAEVTDLLNQLLLTKAGKELVRERKQERATK